MKNIFKTALIFVVTIILVCTVFTLIACKNTTTPKPGGEGEDTGNVNYTITVQRNTGHPFANATVLLYPKDGSRPYFATADDSGTAVIVAPKDDYTVKFANIVEGYKAEGDYTISANETKKTFKLDAEVIPTPAPKNTTYEVGSVFHDFSFTDVFGYEYSLSKLLKSKKAVLLNFWYIDCTWCDYEFPDMKAVYESYSDDVAVIAFNTNYRDTKEAIIQYATEKMELPFIIVDSTEEPSYTLFQAFGFEGNPSSVMIDRQGVACFVESGALAGDTFNMLFSRYTSEPYEPYIYFPNENHNEKPDVDAPDPSEVAGAINASGMNATYESFDDEYNWPWIIDGDSIRTSNTGKHSSYSIISANVSMKKDQCIAFDYKLSTEANYDLFLVHVGDLLMHAFSGKVDEWVTCYAYVPMADGDYTLTFSYAKDDSKAPEDDYVAIKNVRFVSVDAIDSRTEILYRASSGEIVGNQYSDYITPVYNPDDGYYHVGTANGPLLLADLMNANTAWSNASAWSYVEVSGLEYDLNGDGIAEDYTDSFITFAQIANNSPKYGFLAVTEDIKTNLMALTGKFSGEHDKEWLELCSYVVVYGANGEVLGDPAIGLGAYNAFEAVLSEDPDHPKYNKVVKDYIIMPRGIYFKFIPDETAIYKINSVGDKDTYCFLYDSRLRMIMESDESETPGGKVDGNFTIRTLLEKGNVYYFALDFSNLEEVGSFDFVINKLATSGNLWVHASSTDYETVMDEEGNLLDIVLRSAVDYVLGEDGVYHVKNEDGTLGSKIYIDLTHPTYMFPQTSLKEALDMTCYYCKVCGMKYNESVEYFESDPNPICGVCLSAGKSNFERRNMFALPTPVRDENGKIRVLEFTHEDIETGYFEKVYVPIFELNTSEQVDYTNPEKYLEDLHVYGIKFVDYSDVLEEYIRLAETEGYFPAEEEAEGPASHAGCIEATAELVEILNKFIVFGDYSISYSIENSWLMLSYYYLYLA